MERSGIRDELRACSRIPFTLHPGYSAEVFLRSVNEGVMVRFSAFKRSKSPVKEGNSRSVRGDDGVIHYQRPGAPPTALSAVPAMVR